MPTNTAGTNARNTQLSVVHCIRADITFADNGRAVPFNNAIPAGSQIINAISGVYVNTAFNAGTSNVLDIGTTADDDLYGTDLALGTKAFVTLDEAATATGVNTWYLSDDTYFTCTPALSGTAATAGSAVVLICYYPPNG